MRNFVIRLGVTALCLTLCLGGSTAQAHHQAHHQAHDQAHHLSPSGALAALRAGNRRFVAGTSVPKPLGAGVRRTLARGQSPQAIVVTCTDSRVTPEHVFNAGLGELFVIRTSGGVCDPETLASIEHAATDLGTPLCIVMAHTHCTAVKAAADGKDHTVAVAKLLERIHPSVVLAREQGLSGQPLLRRAERENAYSTIAEALRRSQALRALADQGEFRMVAAQYHLDSGKVEWLPHRKSDTPQSPDSAGYRPAARGLPPHTVLTMLHAGHHRYLSQAKATGDISPTRRKALLKGNRPMAIVVTCADSRVPPEHIFDVGLGDLCVIRVAGNIANDEVTASIEHAVATTGVSLCIVLGHQDCVTVGDTITHAKDPDLSPSMRLLLRRIEPAVERARRLVGNGPRLLPTAIEENTRNFLANLRTQSQRLRRLELDGTFALVPAVYMLDTGDIRWLKDASPKRSELAAATGDTAGTGTQSSGHHPSTHLAHGGAKSAHDSSPHRPADHQHSEPGQDVHDEHNADGHHPSPAYESQSYDLGHDQDGDHDSDHGDSDHGDSDHGDGENHGIRQVPVRGDRDDSLLMTLMAAALVTIAGLMGLLYWQRRGA